MTLDKNMNVSSLKDENKKEEKHIKYQISKINIEHRVIMLK